MSGLRHRFDDLKPATMLERGDFRAGGRHGGRIDHRHDHARVRAALGQNATPRVDDERMPESFSPVLVLATLRGCEHEGAVLDRPRAAQHMPMSFAGLSRERRGDGEKRTSGIRKRAVKGGEAKIKADRETES